MPYDLWKKALRLLGLNAIIVVISLIIIFSLSGLVDQPWYRLLIDGLCVVILMLFIWGSMSEMGLKDITNDELEKKRVERLGHEPVMGVPVHYQPANGYVIGAVAQSPFVIMALLLIIPAMRETLLVIILNAWFIMFSEFNTSLNFPWYLYLGYTAFFTVLAGLAYQNGITKKKRIKTIIERNEKKLKTKQKPTPKKG